MHVAIQDAMGWMDGHLHQFHKGSPYGRETKIFSYPWPDDFERENIIDERSVIIVECLQTPKDKIWYEYDFGDGWMHEVFLQKILPFEPKAEYPQLIDGANACPWEDSGGLGGYYNMIEALKDPKNSEHNSYMEWLGLEDPSDFDPTEFEKDAIEFRDPKDVLKEYALRF